MSATLTELEACVLGLMREAEPCTAYAVRRLLQQSPNPYWSGSAGAIYPLVRRLEGAGLLRSRPESTGQRRSDLYATTAKGKRALQAWLTAPLQEWATAIPMDPLRVRVRFLRSVSNRQRKEFLQQAQEETRKQINKARERCRVTRNADDPFPYLMARGALRLSRARLAWLDEVSAHPGLGS